MIYKYYEQKTRDNAGVLIYGGFIQACYPNSGLIIGSIHNY